eukprot:7037276-Lingulodinium_polyedra.AAC.1
MATYAGAWNANARRAKQNKKSPTPASKTIAPSDNPRTPALLGGEMDTNRSNTQNAWRAPAPQQTTRKQDQITNWTPGVGAW